jgi:hypothetical protein
MEAPDDVPDEALLEAREILQEAGRAELREQKEIIDEELQRVGEKLQAVEETRARVQAGKQETKLAEAAWQHVQNLMSLGRRRTAYQHILERLALGQPLPWEEDDTESGAGADELPPVREARVVFAGRSRAPGSKTYISDEVVEWATDALYWYLRDGSGAEDAKDRVLGIAERHDYHFTRRTLERQLEGQISDMSR